jgi:hypothetical protein
MRTFFKAKHNRFHAGPPAWIERKFTFFITPILTKND